MFTFLADLRYVGQEHTIAIPVADAALLCRDIGAAARRCSTPSTTSAMARPRPTSGSRCVNVRLVVTAGRVDTLAEQWLAQPWQPEPPVAEAVA